MSASEQPAAQEDAEAQRAPEELRETEVALIDEVRKRPVAALLGLPAFFSTLLPFLFDGVSRSWGWGDPPMAAFFTAFLMTYFLLPLAYLFFRQRRVPFLVFTGGALVFLVAGWSLLLLADALAWPRAMVAVTLALVAAVPFAVAARRRPGDATAPDAREPGTWGLAGLVVIGVALLTWPTWPGTSGAWTSAYRHAFNRLPFLLEETHAYDARSEIFLRQADEDIRMARLGQPRPRVPVGGWERTLHRLDSLTARYAYCLEAAAALAAAPGRLSVPEACRAEPPAPLGRDTSHAPVRSAAYGGRAQARPAQQAEDSPAAALDALLARYWRQADTLLGAVRLAEADTLTAAIDAARMLVGEHRSQWLHRGYPDGAFNEWQRSAARYEYLVVDLGEQQRAYLTLLGAHRQARMGVLEATQTLVQVRLLPYYRAARVKGLFLFLAALAVLGVAYGRWHRGRVDTHTQNTYIVGGALLVFLVTPMLQPIAADDIRVGGAFRPFTLSNWNLPHFLDDVVTPSVPTAAGGGAAGGARTVIFETDVDTLLKHLEAVGERLDGVADSLDDLSGRLRSLETMTGPAAPEGVATLVQQQLRQTFERLDQKLVRIERQLAVGALDVAEE